MARNSVLTAAQENTGIDREAVVTVPGVEQAGWRLLAVILMKGICNDNLSFSHTSWFILKI